MCTIQQRIPSSSLASIALTGNFVFFVLLINLSAYIANSPLMDDNWAYASRWHSLDSSTLTSSVHWVQYVNLVWKKKNRLLQCRLSRFRTAHAQNEFHHDRRVYYFQYGYSLYSLYSLCSRPYNVPTYCMYLNGRNNSWSKQLMVEITQGRNNSGSK